MSRDGLDRLPDSCRCVTMPGVEVPPRMTQSGWTARQPAHDATGWASQDQAWPTPLCRVALVSLGVALVQGLLQPSELLFPVLLILGRCSVMTGR